jgi:hypothetical protein
MSPPGDRRDDPTPPGHAVARDGFMTIDMEAFAHKLADQMDGRGNSGRRFLGLDLGSWTKLSLGWLLALVVAMATWWLAVRDGLRERPTLEQIDEIIDVRDATHGGAADAHPPIQRRLDTIDSEQRMIRDSQIRQEQIDKTQTDVLKDIKGDLRRLRRHRDQ